VSYPLLLDEMLSDDIADQLRKRGHDVLAVVADTGLVGLPDDQILAQAAAQDRALVTANIKDFMPLDAQYKASGRQHAGLILISTKTFPQNRTFTAVVDALAALLARPAGIGPDQVVFLAR
jgi:predicted nuclease of predicted toxin-antitoxin system